MVSFPRPDCSQPRRKWISPADTRAEKSCVAARDTTESPMAMCDFSVTAVGSTYPDRRVRRRNRTCCAKSRREQVASSYLLVRTTTTIFSAACERDRYLYPTWRLVIVPRPFVISETLRCCWIARCAGTPSRKSSSMTQWRIGCARGRCAGHGLWFERLSGRARIRDRIVRAGQRAGPRLQVFISRRDCHVVRDHRE